MIQNEKINRDELIEHLKEFNVHARAAFPRMSLFPMYQARFSNPIATKVMTSGFNLPANALITNDEIDFVSNLILDYVKTKTN